MVLFEFLGVFVVAHDRTEAFQFLTDEVFDYSEGVPWEWVQNRIYLDGTKLPGEDLEPNWRDYMRRVREDKVMVIPLAELPNQTDYFINGGTSMVSITVRSLIPHLKSGWTWDRDGEA